MLTSMCEFTEPVNKNITTGRNHIRVCDCAPALELDAPAGGRAGRGLQLANRPIWESPLIMTYNITRYGVLSPLDTFRTDARSITLLLLETAMLEEVMKFEWEGEDKDMVRRRSTAKVKVRESVNNPIVTI
ncbi:hypothetical protein EVAR_20656_1 [Eumeta japonica]|uniref:Uncharacterized protein n=1 Tax=Eumeta variegata TaxID=151549 RepID=A0A4C1VBA9_EUMVA|nr:hypothetical protein EVAR_20656_1 [Eumeta japonica]